MSGSLILLTTGIGDCLALESYLTDEEVSAVTEVHWAARASSLLIALFESCPAWQHVKHIDRWEGYGPGAGCYDHHQPEIDKSGLWDWSIVEQFGELKYRQHQGSRLLGSTLATLDGFELPPRYLVCCPSTPFNTGGTRELRDFNRDDWRGTIERAEAHGLPVLVLNSEGAEPAPTHPLIHDYQGATTVAESLEILKGAEGYIGIDSYLSVAATRVLPLDRVEIKCIHTWALLCKDIYFTREGAARCLRMRLD